MENSVDSWLNVGFGADKSNESVQSQNENRYFNPWFRISLDIPPGWFVLNTSEMRNLMELTEFQGEFEELRTTKPHLFDEPLVIITKYDPANPLYYGVVTPAATLFVTPRDRELQDLSLLDFANAFSSKHPLGYSLLKGFEMLHVAHVNPFSGYESILCKTRYEMEIKNESQTFPIELDIYLVMYDAFFVQLNLAHCKAMNQTADDEFAGIVKSFQLLGM